MAAYIPKHAARDAAICPAPPKSEKRKLAPNAIAAAKTYVPAKPVTDVEERPKSAEEEAIDPLTKKPVTYVPKHAGADHARLHSTGMNIDLDHPLLRKVGILPSGDPFNERAHFSDANYDSSDYEHFLQAYRVAMTKVPVSGMTTTTVELKPARDISDEASHRRSSTSSFARRGSNAPSVFEKIGHYIKPSRPDSMYSTSSWMTSQTADTSPMASRRGSAMTQRWSNGSMSKELDRDAAAIENAVLEAWDGRRRSKVASSPMSPVMKRFCSNTSAR